MKLLIAEDEQATREGLLQCIPSIFTQVRATGNGQTAYQIALEMKPDVLLCDIRMPKLNGIELARLLRQHFPDIHILFISGYSDKEYLKAAITLQADGYLEKPIDEAELERFLNRAAEQIRARHRDESQQEQLQQRASLYARHQLLQSLLRCPERLPEALRMNDTLASPLCQAGQYLAVCLHLGWDDADATQLSDTPEQQLAELIRKQLPTTSLCSAQTSTYIGAVVWGEAACPGAIRRCLENALHAALAARPHLNRVQVCLSQVCDSVHQLHSLYKAARAQTQWLCFASERSLVCSMLPTGAAPSPEDRSALLAQHLRAHRLAEARRLISEQSAAIVRQGTGSIPAVRQYYEKLLSVYIGIQGEQQPLGSMHSMELLSAFSRLDTLPEMTRFLLVHIDDLLPPIPVPDHASDKVIQVMDCIRRNLADSALSVQSIAASMGLTENYLSALYKRETGRTLHKDIIELRLDRARYLLLRGFSLTAVAEKTGFSSASYFQTVFKRQMGISPAEYVRRHRQGTGEEDTP